jgi:dephospho-CoA kinase
MNIIGITGTLGAGKGTIVKYLVENEGFVHFSVRRYIAEEIIKRGLEVNRDTLTSIANDLRAKNSPSYIIDELYKKADRTGKNCVIESIRTPGEVFSLRKKGNFYLFAVDADPEIRYKRIKARQSETDQVSFDIFLENEKREYISDDPNKQNLKKCIELADFLLINNKTIKQLNNQIKATLKEINLNDDSR